MGGTPSSLETIVDTIHFRALVPCLGKISEYFAKSSSSERQRHSDLSATGGGGGQIGDGQADLAELQSNFQIRNCDGASREESGDSLDGDPAAGAAGLDRK